jgi:hypothetical protein
MKTSIATAVLRESVHPALTRAYYNICQRAKKGKVECSLTPEELFLLWQQCEGRCAVSGLEFSDEIVERAFVKKPFAPSLDRRDPTKGYSLHNIQITCVAANFAMNEWGIEILRRLASGVVEREQEEKEENRPWFRRQRAKLRDAETALASLKGEARLIQKHRIAGLKRALTMGPMKCSNAAIDAWEGIKARSAAAGRQG